MKTIEMIEKEQIQSLRFTKKEVLTDKEAIIRRERNLHRAQTLGNLLRNKVRITFIAADEKTYQVQTTVWAVGSSFIELKRGIYIPINAILEVD
jgi:hypothetical protein